MWSTLSKYRTVARMVYPQYIEFEEWVKSGSSRTSFLLDTRLIQVSRHYEGFEVKVNNDYLIPMIPNGTKEIKAIYVFWQAERYAKGNESVFAPRRSEPGVVE